MSGPNSYRPRHSHPINGLSLIPQHVLNSNRNTPSPRLSRPAIDPYKAFTANDLDGFVDSITSKIRNALLGQTPTDPQPKTKPHSRTSDVFGKLQSIPPFNSPDLGLAPAPSGSNNQSSQNPPGITVPAEEIDDDSDDNHEDSIQPRRKTHPHIEVNSDDDIRISSPHDSQAVQNGTSQVSSRGNSSSGDDSDDPDVSSVSNHAGSESSGDRRPASQDLNPDALSYLNKSESPVREDFVSIDDSGEQSVSSMRNSSHSQQTSSKPKSSGVHRPSPIEDEAAREDLLETDSNSSSIFIQLHRSSSKLPASHISFAPSAQPTHSNESSDDREDVDSENVDEFEDEDEDSDGSDDDVAVDDLKLDGDEYDLELNGENMGVDDQVADIAVNLNGEGVEAVKSPQMVGRPRELEDGEIEEDEIEPNQNDPQDLLAADILVAEPFIPIYENIQNRNQSPHPKFESSLNSGSDPGPEDTQHFGNEQATVDVDWSPIRDQNPSHLPEPRSSPSRALRQNQHQSPNCPDSNGSHSQLVQDDHLLPINSAPTSPLAPNEPKIRSGSSSHSLPIELEGATHQREASPRATSSKCDTTELQSVSSKNENLPKDQEEQTEDDNDLFEGDKDLRLHRLGVGKSRSHDSNRKEDESCPAVEPTDEVEDRFSSIEKQLETYMARTEEPQLTEGEEKIQRAIAEPPHPSSISNSTVVTNSESATVNVVVQYPSQVDRQVVQNSIRPNADRDVNLPASSDEILPPAEDTLMSTAEETQSRSSTPDQNQNRAVRPSLDVLWGELSPVEGLSQVAQETRMNEVTFFPLKQSDSEIFNSASWTPALSTSISSDDHRASTGLYGSTEIKYSIISLTLPQRSNVRQTLNFDEDIESTVEPPSDGHDEMNVEDYDMLASSLIDGNSDVGVTDPENLPDQVIRKEDAKVVPSDSFLPSSRDQTGEDKLQDEKPSVAVGADTNPSVQSTQPALSPSEDPVGVQSPPKASNSVLNESDMLLSQFLNCSSDEADGSNLDDPPATDLPAPVVPFVPAVTFATSPPTEMTRSERFDDPTATENPPPFDMMINVQQTSSAFEPQTPRTSTTVGHQTSSESSEKHLSRGSAYSAPSSVVSSDAASVPASVAPPPPLHNPSMGAPTEAVGLSNQMTRRSSIDSSTHAEPPSPSTSTRHRSAPITQEQVNAPGLPHIEAAEIASPSSSGLPDPLRSPPLLIQPSISTRLAEIDNPASRASSMVAFPPSSSCSNALEGSHMSIDTSQRDASPQFDPRLLLPDPIATPLSVSIPAIKLEDLPTDCLSIERHRLANSSAASQAATSPRFEKFQSTVSPATQTSDALIERNLQAVDEVDTSDRKASSASPTHNTTPARHDRADDAVSQHSGKALDKDKGGEPSPEPPLSFVASPIQPTEDAIGCEKDVTKFADPVAVPSFKILTETPDKNPLSIADPVVEPTDFELYSTPGETIDPQRNIGHESTTNEVTKSIADAEPDPAVSVEVEPDLAINGEADPLADAKQEPNSDGVQNPLEVVEPTGPSFQPGSITRNKRKRSIPAKGPTVTARPPEIVAKEQGELDREAQLREILRKRRARRPSTPDAAPQPKQAKKQQTASQTPPTIETKKKKNVVKRDANRSKGEASFEGEVELNLPSDATEADARTPPVRSRLPRAAKRSSLAPNSPSNLNAGDELSNSLVGFERDDPSLHVQHGRKSSRHSRSTASPIPPASTVSVMIPQLRQEDMVPKLRLHQHNSKSKSSLFGCQADHHQALEGSYQHDTDSTESKPAVVGARTGRRKQSEGTEGRALPPPSLPPVTRSHCHFIRLQFPKDADRRFDTFLVPQCATGDEEIKKKMKGLQMIEDDNLTGEEQSRGIRIGPDGHKHADERSEHPSLLTLKSEYSNFAVDDETLNILIDIFGLSLIQDGQVEVLLPKKLGRQSLIY
ncbi:hypothetical protein VP01_33g11 [Puccinia sorghi]|uniref:Uncharacterized protein n=1 Tax=Puccinia sorghi TaxID=27349 RepID=A0A0L6UWM1_9BASI|nr:hypothetical protein VP01_33g11 [Puccinia sorghi]